MSHSARISWMRHLAVAGLLAALLTLADCGRPAAVTGQSGKNTPTPAPTFTAAPARPLEWQARTLPASVANTYGALSFAPSPVDSALVWLCAPQGSVAQVWVSHDRAATWQRVSDVDAGGEVDACSVIPDDLDPATAVVETDLLQKGCCVLPPIPYALRVTRDSGHTWTAFRGPEKTLLQLATYHGSVYALFAPPFADMSPFQSHFVVSADGLRTWRALDDRLATHGADPVDSYYVRRFWLNPATGAMLVYTATSVVWTDRFLASSDGGATWQDLRAPQADDFVVRTPFAAGPWEICGVRTSDSSFHPSWSNTMPCTLDGGATWRTRTITPVGAAFAIANDGSVLGVNGSTLMRLAPSGKDWESLGSLSASYMPPNAYVAGSGNGVIWNVPGWGGSSNGTAASFAIYA